MRLGDIFLILAFLFLSVISFSQEKTVSVNDDFIRVLENSSFKANILNNDFGLSDGVESLEIITPPKHGEAVVTDNTFITYSPKDSYYGEDSFTYKVCNTYGSCGEATVEIQVDNIDFKPKAVNDTVTYLHGEPVQINFLENDLIEGDRPWSIFFLSDLNRGSFEELDEGLLEVEFERTFVGMDSMQYQVCDSDNDCTEAYIFFKVIHGGGVEFYVPQGFSPNGDGINDTFYVPDFTSYAGIQVQIFDSWGNLVYESKDYKNDWDGMANNGSNKGRIINAGTYYYKITISGVNEAITGFVQVVK
jgi:gliding motility-associated-like protein